MANSTTRFKFSFLDKVFLGNLVEARQIVWLRWKLVPRLIWISWIDGNIHLSSFGHEIRFLGKFGQKSYNCLFKMKSVTLTNSNVLTWMVKFKFYLLDWKCSFWSDLVQKIKIVCSRWRSLPTQIQICWIWL